VNPFAELHETLHNEKCLLSYCYCKLVYEENKNENCIFGMFLSESIYKKREEKRRTQLNIFSIISVTFLQMELL
jgi:hypothetical protein